MNDLIIDCKFKNGPSLIRGFDTIMDFIEAYEHGQFSCMEKNIKYVKVKLFENKFNVKEFETLQDAYNHCQMITK